MTTMWSGGRREIDGVLARSKQLTASVVLTFLALALGIGLRVQDFANHRELWMDEAALLENVADRPILELGVPLKNEQMVAPGYLVFLRLWVRAAGASLAAIRLPSLVLGIAGMFALAATARRFVAGVAVPMALALAALSDDLIYYAVEFKQYSGDFLIACGLLALGAGRLDRPWTRRDVALGATLGAAATWMSHPSIFLLAALGGVLTLDAIVRRDRTRLVGIAMMGAAWAAGFASCLALSERMMTPESRDFLAKWWGFSFLPLPPRSLDDARRAFWQATNAFSNPLSLTSPGGMVAAALIGLACFLAGSVALARRDWRKAGLVLLPIALTMAASALGRYPFHGRVLLFLVPCLILPIAESVALAGRRGGRPLAIALAVLLLIGPSGDALYRVAILQRGRTFDSHGDQRNDMLDVLYGRR